MTGRLTPNPHSPYADADPEYRHVVSGSSFLGNPTPGGLIPTACERLAVVPEEPLRSAYEDATLPVGLCPACVTVMQGGETPVRPVSNCRECESLTAHDGLCALCRQEKHEAWWPTRGAAEQPAAEGEQTATLLVDRTSSTCGACGQPTLASALTHADVSGYAPKRGGGCGARFTAIRSDNRAVTEDDLHSLRPDLPIAP